MSDTIKEKTYTTTLSDLARIAHDRALDDGQWRSKESQSLPALLMLVVSDLSAILEEDRRGGLQTVSERLPAINRFEEGVADVFISLLDIVGAHKLDIEMALRLKLMSTAEKRGKRY